MRLMIDGDWLCYTAGFAGQKTLYLWEHANGKDNFQAEGMGPLRQGLDEAGLDIDDGHIWARTIVDPLDHILHSCKKMIESQVEKAQEKFPNASIATEIYLDGDGNFRNRRAKIRPYKGTRNQAKPVAYNDLRQYLLDNYDTRVVHGMETDDQLAIEMTESPDNTICCAVDKDMLQVPGWHLNPNKGWKKVSPKEGAWRLAMQVLTGDSTDNIGGCYKVGPKKAEQLLPKEATQEEWDAAVRQAFEDSIEKYGDVYNGLNAVQAATENYELVYLLRTEEEAALWKKYLL